MKTDADVTFFSCLNYVHVLFLDSSRILWGVVTWFLLHFTAQLRKLWILLKSNLMLLWISLLSFCYHIQVFLLQFEFYIFILHFASVWNKWTFWSWIVGWYFAWRTLKFICDCHTVHAKLRADMISEHIWFRLN